MCAMLTIQIDGKAGTLGANEGMFAVADVLPISSSTSNQKIRPITGVIIGVGSSQEQASVEVPAGEWLVRAKMPSGEVISQSVTVGASEPAAVQLQGQLAPSDELNYEFAAGAVPSARQQATQIFKSFKLDRGLREIALSDLSIGGGSSRAMPSFKVPGFDRTDVDRGTDDRSFIKASPRVALDIFERALKREPAKQLSEVSFAAVLSAIDIHATQSALGGDEKLDGLAKRLFGDEVERRPSTLSGFALLKSTGVDLPQSLFEPGNKWAGGQKPVRAFGWLRAAPDKTFIACIPHSWRVSPSNRPANVRAVVSGEPKDPSRLSLRVVVDDPSVTSILGFLQSGDLDSAERLIRKSVEYLYNKELNPYAAAAATYALVHAPGAVDLSEPWPQWVRNLSNWYPDIPDGPILLSTLLLQRGAGEESVGRPGSTPDQNRPGFHECRKLLLRAVCCGPPIYRLGLKLLAENIDIVRSLERELESPTRELDRAAELVRWMSLRVDTSQPFTVMRI